MIEVDPCGAPIAAECTLGNEETWLVGVGKAGVPAVGATGCAWAGRMDVLTGIRAPVAAPIDERAASEGKPGSCVERPGEDVATEGVLGETAGNVAVVPDSGDRGAGTPGKGIETPGTCGWIAGAEGTGVGFVAPVTVGDRWLGCLRSSASARVIDMQTRQANVSVVARVDPMLFVFIAASFPCEFLLRGQGLLKSHFVAHGRLS